MNIPTRLQPFLLNPCYFETYHGDIYHGTFFQSSKLPDYFFIIPNANWRKVNELDVKQHTLDVLSKLGKPIPDPEIISRAYYENELSNRLLEYKFKRIHTSEKQFKQMFIFGAAASTFCVFGDKAEEFRNFQFNPPTGFEIFAEKYTQIVARYPGASSSLSNFELRGNTIEDCLEDEWQISKQQLNVGLARNHISIQFYLQELFQEISKEVIAKYSRYNLLSQMMRQMSLSKTAYEVPIVVSFNYDTILDQFIELHFGTRFDNTFDYIDWHKTPIALFKPHGSSNWGWKINRNDFQNLSRHTASTKIFNDQLMPNEIFYSVIGPINYTVSHNTYGHELMLNKDGLGRYTLNKSLINVISADDHTAYYPALLLPYKDKDEFIMPYEHTIAMQLAFKQIKELTLIGWKGNEALFNRQLFQNANDLEKITIVNPEPDEVKKNLERAGFNLGNFEIAEVGDFEKYVRKFWC